MVLEQFAVETARGVTRVVEVTGVMIIAGGAFGTLLLFLYRAVRGGEITQDSIAMLRSSLGRAILLGLEFLVAADIINTVAVEPTLTSVAVLAGIVAIRTFLSFSLEMEIQGRLPWRHGSRAPEA